MNTADESCQDESRQTNHWLRRMSLRAFLLGIGCVLFVAAGITGAMVTLIWLI